jgi:hypothetical protein
MCAILREQIERRHSHVMALKRRADESLTRARDYVQAALGLQVWAHGVYRQVSTDPPSRSAERSGNDHVEPQDTSRPGPVAGVCGMSA